MLLLLPVTTVVFDVAAAAVPISTLRRFPPIFVLRPERHRACHLGLSYCLSRAVFIFSSTTIEQDIEDVNSFLFGGHFLRFRVFRRMYTFVTTARSLLFFPEQQ